MKFGLCGTVKMATVAKASGFDYLEENAQQLLQPQVEHPNFADLAIVAGCGLPVLAANCLLPATLKVTGPAVDLSAVQHYLRVLLPRAREVGIQTLVFGSGQARQIPEGFPKAKAFGQIVGFLQMAGGLAELHGITLAVEHLHRQECNIINSVAEAVEYVQAAHCPAVKVVADSYHFWTENESLQNLRDALPYLHHVHVADKEGRMPPGESGRAAAAKYRDFFGVLKQGGYKGTISVECHWPNNRDDLASVAPRVLAFLKAQWN